MHLFLCSSGLDESLAMSSLTKVIFVLQYKVWCRDFDFRVIRFSESWAKLLWFWTPVHLRQHLPASFGVPGVNHGDHVKHVLKPKCLNLHQHSFCKPVLVSLDSCIVSVMIMEMVTLQSPSIDDNYVKVIVKMTATWQSWTFLSFIGRLISDIE